MDDSVEDPPEPPNGEQAGLEPAGTGSHQQEEQEEVYNLYNIGRTQTQPPIHVQVDLNGRPHLFELDTGASVSVCSERVYQRLWPADQRPRIEPFVGRLRTYSGETLRVAGQITVHVRYGTDQATLPLVVL